jgi:tetratricopeptide (TPR) repeat protein
MPCPRIDSARYHDVVRTVTLIFVWLTCLFAIASAAFAQTPSQKTRDILMEARLYQMRFRSGDVDVLPAYVSLLEEATKAEPGNADISYAMGVAYLAQAARALMPGGNPPDAMAAMQKGPAALRRALQLNPNHAEALAVLGGVQAMMGSFMQAPAMTARGVTQMNRAVEIAPSSTRARLQRAFSGLSLPDELRNHATEAEDLDFLATAAGKTRAGDYVRIMRADLYFETGQPELARPLYRAVSESSSPAAAEAAARLMALEKGGVAMSDIKALRTAAGAQCTLCHGKR